MPAFNFKARFAKAVAQGRKRQTIRGLRADGRPPCRFGSRLTFYRGMRTKNCAQIGAGTCTAVWRIQISNNLEVEIDGFRVEEVDEVAKLDGFRSTAAFFDFFKQTHGLPFEGWLIRWRYD